MTLRTLHRDHRYAQRLTTRRDGEARRDLTSQSLALRADSINVEARTIEAVFSTGNRVNVVDWQRYEIIEEILIPSGCELPSNRQVPMLDSHMAYGLTTIRGSGRDIKISVSQVDGRLYFAKDEESVRAFDMVREGHVTDVSVGYRVLEFVDIEPGQTREVAGKSYKAGSRRLRITTRWRLHEISLVAIGADPAAKMRGEDDPHSSPAGKIPAMNKKLRSYLELMGLRSDADDVAAWAYFDGLQGTQRSMAIELHNAEPLGRAAVALAAPAAATPAAPAAPVVETGEVLERRRVVTINERAGGDVPRELVAQAISEGWDTERASTAFMNHMRSRLTPTNLPTGDGNTPASSPAGHSRSHEIDINSRALTARLITQFGGDAIGVHMRGERGCYENGQAVRLTERDADMGDQLGTMGLRAACREALTIERRQIPRDEELMIRAAFSTTTLLYAFTTSIYARLVSAYLETPDTTDWCDTEDVMNFQVNDDIKFSRTSQPKELPRGTTANDATFSDDKESYKAVRYALKATFDEQDLIDDRLGVILNRVPKEMGEAFNAIMPDLVYSLLLTNPTMNDGIAAFNTATHVNKVSEALSRAAIQNCFISMAKQRASGRAITSQPTHLTIPTDLMFTAKQILGSSAIFIKGNTDGEQGNINTVEGMLQIRAEPRLTTAGCYNPRTGATVAGSATNWWAFVGGRCVRKIYRTGTNRRPTVRPYTLTQGQWGLGWDMCLDAGAAIVEWRNGYQGNA